MSDPSAGGSDAGGGRDKDPAVAKTAGFVVFSGIAVSILRTLFPKSDASTQSQPKQEEKASTLSSEEPVPVKKPLVPVSEEKKTFAPRTIEIVKGDTLWGLSRKYGVSIDAIKEANGLSGDTIYAGRKLVIP